MNLKGFGKSASESASCGSDATAGTVSNVNSWVHEGVTLGQGHSLSRRVEWSLVVLITIAGGLLRFYQLDVADGTIDELGFSTGLLGRSLFEWLSVFKGAPLPFVFQWFTMLLTGNDARFDIRLSSAIIGTLSIPLIYRWVRSLGSQTTAFTVACLFACSYYHFMFSREGRYYACVVFFAIFFLWFSGLLVQRFSIRNIILFMLSAACLVLSHYFCVLAVCACLLVLPVCLLSKLSLSRPTRRHIAPICAGALILPLAWYLRKTFFPWINMGFLQRHANRGELTHAFDISPRFTFNRFMEYLGVSEITAYFMLVLAVLGIVCLTRRNWRCSLIYLSILTAPWIIIFYAKPKHFWDAKYFIFMLPILYLLLGLGVSQIVSFASSLLFRGNRRRQASLCLSVCVNVLLGVVVCFSNLEKISSDYRYPKNGIQQAVKMLSKAALPSDTLYCTSKKALRFFEYSSKAHQQDFMQIVKSYNISGVWNLEEAEHIWVADIGRKLNSRDEASFLLSDRFSRIPLRSYWGHLLGYGPNIQGIQFGHNTSGSPESTGRLVLSPYEAASVSVLFPREGTRAVVATVRYELDRSPLLTCSIGNGQSVNLDALDAPDGNWQTYVGMLDVPFGKETVRIVNNSDSTVDLKTLSFAPILHGNATTIPAWDFLEVKYGLAYGIHIQSAGPELLLETLMNSHLVYAFFVPYDMDFTVTLRGKNDRPFDNKYSVCLMRKMSQTRSVLFGERDDSITARTTTSLYAKRGLNLLVVAGIAPNSRLYNAAQYNMFGHKVTTLERGHQNGLVEITLNPSPALTRLGDSDAFTAMRMTKVLAKDDVLFYYGKPSEPDGSAGSSDECELHKYLHEFIRESATLSNTVAVYTGTQPEQLRDVMRKHPTRNIWIFSEDEQLGAADLMALFALDPNPTMRGEHTVRRLPPPSMNLFPYGNFERNRLGNVSLYGGAAIVGKPYARGGKKALKLECAEAGDKAQASFWVVFDEDGNQTTSLKDGETYTLSFWMKHQNIEPGGGYWSHVIKVALVGKSAQGEPFFNSIMLARGTKGWTHYVLPFTVGEDLPAHLNNVCVEIGLFGGTGALWLDDVQLEPGDRATPFTSFRRPSHTERLALMGF